MDGTEALTVDPADFEILSPEPANTVSGKHRRLRALLSTWWKQAQQLKTEAHVYFYAFRHPGMPWYARLVALCTAGYLVSPIQLIPSFIPVIGFLDDFLVLFCGAKLLQRITPPGVLAECRERVKIEEQTSASKTTSLASAVSFLTISVIWLLVAVAATVLMVGHLHH